MLKLISILVFFCLFKAHANLSKPEKEIYQLEKSGVLFKEFINKYEKKYNSLEVDYRHEVFKDNLRKINKWNDGQRDAIFGIGPFADLTFEEFIETHAGFLGNFTNGNAVKYRSKPVGAAPESLDWRQKNVISRVKNQKHCGSCYVFSAIGAIESQYAMKKGQLIELSEQQGLDCGSTGCDSGLPHITMQELAKTGCMRESDYPYEGQKKQCRADPSKVVVKVTGGNQLLVSSEEELKDAVASMGPLSVGIKLDPQMPHFKGGVLKPIACNGSGHALLLAGYGTDSGTPYWLMKNSWGQNWNEAGYLRLIRGERACDIGSYVASPTVA